MDGSCRLIELSSFQFDAEISDERLDEKSWWLNIEKHARALLSFWSPLVFDGGGVVDLWEPLFAVTVFATGPDAAYDGAYGDAVFPACSGMEEKNTVENLMKTRRSKIASLTYSLFLSPAYQNGASILDLIFL